jgi:hypothetical protein
MPKHCSQYPTLRHLKYLRIYFLWDVMPCWLVIAGDVSEDRSAFIFRVSQSKKTRRSFETSPAITNRYRGIETSATLLWLIKSPTPPPPRFIVLFFVTWEINCTVTVQTDARPSSGVTNFDVKFRSVWGTLNRTDQYLPDTGYMIRQ